LEVDIRVTTDVDELVSRRIPGQRPLRGGADKLTATSTPCIGLYKPVFVEAGLPDIGPEPRAEYDPRTT